MKILIITVISSLLLMFVSCDNKAPQKIETTNQTDMSDNSENLSERDETTDTADYSDKIAALLSDKTGFVSRSIPLDRRYSAFRYKNKLYLYLNYHLYEMNFVTGKLQRICRDPLCQHTNSNTCLAISHYLSFYVDNGNVYVLGEYQKNHDGFRYIGTLDPEAGSRTIIYDWDGSVSANSNSFECHDGYLYYVKEYSDTTNALYRYSIDSNKEERLSGTDEYIAVFTVSDDMVYYRNVYGILKAAPLDFSEVTEIDDKAGIMFVADGYLYYTEDLFDENGNQNSYNLLRVPISDVTAAPEAVIRDTANASDILYCDGTFYYTLKTYIDDKTIYAYNPTTGQTQMWSTDYGARCMVTAVIDELLVLEIRTEPDENGDIFIECYIFDTTSNELIPLILD